MILLAVVYFADPKQHRWIRFGPFGGLQPSEFAKPALALFLAYFIALRSRAINSRYTLLPAILARRASSPSRWSWRTSERPSCWCAPPPWCSSSPDSRRATS